MKLHHEPHESPGLSWRENRDRASRAYIEIGDVTLEVGLDDTRELGRVVREAHQHLIEAEYERRRAHAEWARGQSAGTSLTPTDNHRLEVS